MKVRCAGETACRGQMLLRLGTRGRTLAKAAVNVAPGKSATVRLKLKRADRRLGRRAPKVTLTFGTQKLERDAQVLTSSIVSIGSSWSISGRRSSQCGGMHMWVPSSSTGSSIVKPASVE